METNEEPVTVNLDVNACNITYFKQLFLCLAYEVHFDDYDQIKHLPMPDPMKIIGVMHLLVTHVAVLLEFDNEDDQIKAFYEYLMSTHITSDVDHD